MLAVLGAFVAPYLIALGAYPLLARRHAVYAGAALATCALIMLAPLLIPQDRSLLRLGAAISATIVVEPRMHELIFAIAVGRVQGYQTGFFAVQGVAAAATARVDARGWTKIASVAATLAFLLGSSVLFFASIHALTPFYSRGLPAWLWAR